MPKNGQDKLGKKEVQSHGLRAADQAVLEKVAEFGSNLELPHAVHHYLYFPTEDTARRAGARLSAEGYEIEIRLGADDVNWLTLASHRLLLTPENVIGIRFLMESVASSLGGEYDGWEAVVEPS